MTLYSKLALGALALTLGACQVTPPVTPAAMMCNFDPIPLEVEVPPENAGMGREGELADLMRASLASAPARVDGELPSMLFMSGGGEHGAFGAGYLDGWAGTRPNGRLPQYRVVTGISTGSILATFAFLGDTAKMVQGYSITSERELLVPFIRVRDGHPTPGSLIRVMREGAVADLAPLRARLLEEITPAVLAQVSEAHRGGRKLLVGAVDVDLGQAMVFDLTRMADRFVAAQTDAQRELLRGCYAEAILASSSAPLAARPVFIDNRMYVDGGVRFGMFSDEIVAVTGRRGPATPVAPPLPRHQVYLIVNGNLEVSQECGKADPSLCRPPDQPTGGSEGAHRPWNLVGLAGRSEKLLVNQVYRFSADRVRTQAEAAGNPFHFAKIEDDVDSHSYTLNDPVLGSGTRTCSQWTALDQQLDHPVQFFPRYMRCLIDYARKRGRSGEWR
ncbi:patatin-like phospholipase family protein [Allosphingosinicella sp.]|jgi:hypothetical protein|uniref:patatin-like phospholipase family protein n=1 Tax=Allosphingosinicella sp. TaxID=2823234 RepID=UPI002EEB42B1